jgi:DNA-binding NarL/FixJ family response regulator
VPATRLLVLADPKMLPALASGLREGGRFDVLTLPFGDAGASGAAQRADALAVFYGTPDRPLHAALQGLAAAVRARGGRVVAVLQREQAAQRDDCFRAGASDLLFMPMPKEHFVARLADAVALAYAPAAGVAAAVQVGARGNLVQLAQATVTQAGVHAGATLPFEPGETVRLSWDGFETWGLVVRGAPDTQVRFAGVAPDEEARIRDWLKQAGGARPAAIVPAAPPTPRPAAPARAAPAPAARPQAPAASAAPRPPPVVAPTQQTARAAAPASGASQGGPPPGFADRPRVKDTTPVRPAAAVPRPAAAPAPVRPAAPASAPGRGPQAVPAAPQAPAASNGLSDLFDDGAAPAATEAAPPEAAPLWPEVVPAEACIKAGLSLLVEKKLPADASPELAAAAKKITGVLNLSERGALEKAGTESPFADAMGARIALELLRTEATRLSRSQPPALVDDGGVKAMIQIADAAAARLQKEADGAISRGEVETLQLITASSAALSRDLLSFKEAADRLRGIAAAPRLGAGALDPEVVLPGQIYRPPPKSTEPAPVRAELRDFQGLGETSTESRRQRTLVVCMLALSAGLVNALFFAYPRVHELPPVQGVSRIEISEDTARVTLAPDFAEQQTQAVPTLVQLLRQRGVKSAVLVKPNGSGAGQLSVVEGKVYGVPPPAAPRNDVPLPVVPAQSAPTQAPPQAQPAPAPAAAQPQRAQPQPGRTQTASGEPRR